MVVFIVTIKIFYSVIAYELVGYNTVHHQFAINLKSWIEKTYCCLYLSEEINKYTYNIYVNTHMHIYIFIHTYIYVYIHTYIYLIKNVFKST